MTGQRDRSGRAPTDGYAIASLVLAVLGVGIVAVVFGLVGLSRISRSGRPGRGLAIAGVVIGIIESVAVAAVVVVLLISGASDRLDAGIRRSTASTSATGSQIDTSQLKLGDCLNLPSADQASVTTVQLVSCGSPHDAEVYLVSKVKETGEFPGDGAIGDEADDICQAGYASFVGVAFADSSLEYNDFLPSQGTWAQGDRVVTCVLDDPSGQVTGTLRGSAK